MKTDLNILDISFEVIQINFKINSANLNHTVLDKISISLFGTSATKYSYFNI